MGHDECLTFFALTLTPKWSMLLTPVPFSIEARGAWGPAARKFFVECLKLADGDRDVDLYHWSSAKFSSTWYDTLSVLVAKGRAQVSVAASSGDWSKRIRDMQYTDHEDYTVGS